MHNFAVISHGRNSGRFFALAALLTVTFVLAIGCADNPTLESDMGSDFAVADLSDIGSDAADPPSTRVPLNHRSESVVCDAERPVLPQIQYDGGECKTHDDCTEGVNGRCGGLGENCTYDECTNDETCANGGACRCRQFPADNHRCLPGNCVLNADCGEGYCSPSFGNCGTYEGVVAYYCHTRHDACVDDADCGGIGAYCAFDPAAGYWACSSLGCDG